jgi:hypothetical protein
LFCNFIFSPPLTRFLFFSLLLKLFSPTYYPQLSPIDLLTYIFKLKEDSSPSTYSPINFKCVTFIPTHLLTYIFKLKEDFSPSTYSPINFKCVTFIPTHLFTSHLFIYPPTL